MTKVKQKSIDNLEPFIYIGLSILTKKPKIKKGCDKMNNTQIIDFCKQELKKYVAKKVDMLKQGDGNPLFFEGFLSTAKDVHMKKIDNIGSIKALNLYLLKNFSMSLREWFFSHPDIKKIDSFLDKDKINGILNN